MPIILDAELNISIAASGLTPGAKIEASYQYTAADGSQFNTGSNAATVKSSGVVTFPPTSLDDLSGGRVDQHGTYRVWLREAGSGFNGPPIVDENGDPVEDTVTID